MTIEINGIKQEIKELRELDLRPMCSSLEDTRKTDKIFFYPNTCETESKELIK